MRVANTFDYLLGTWSVERTFDDRVRGVCGSFRGTARVVADPAPEPRSVCATYIESGELSFVDHVGPATRRLRLVPTADGAVAVCFSDGRHLVDVDLTTGVSEGTHLCGTDRYELSTVVRSRSLFEERWSVRGPDAEYDAITWLRRLDG